MLPRLGKSVVRSFAVGTLQVVQAQADTHDRIAVLVAREVKGVVGRGLALTLDCPQELQSGVIKVELCLHSAALGSSRELLHLRNKLLEGTHGESITFLHIKVNISGIKNSIQVLVVDRLAVRASDDIDITVRHLNHALKRGEAHVDLHRVKLERHKRKGIARVPGKVERQGHVETSAVRRILDQRSQSEALTNHLFQALTGLTAELLPHVHVVREHGIDDLTTNGKGSPSDRSKTNLIHPVGVRSGQPVQSSMSKLSSTSSSRTSVEQPGTHSPWAGGSPQGLHGLAQGKRQPVKEVLPEGKAWAVMAGISNSTYIQ